MRRRADNDLLPADAAGVVRVVHDHRLGAVDRRSPEDHLEPHRVQAGDAARECERACHRLQRDRAAVDGDVQAARQTPRIDSGIDAILASLVRRDLGHVEDVADVELMPGHLDAREAVDREVAERVGRRDRRCEKRRSCDEDDEQLLHDDAPFRAMGAHRIEKCGLIASARR